MDIIEQKNLNETKNVRAASKLPVALICLFSSVIIILCASFGVMFWRLSAPPVPVPEFMTEKLVADVRPTVVEVKSVGVTAAISYGSGVIVEDGGKKYIVTNWHVVENSSEVSVRFFGQGGYDVCEVLGHSSYHDIAALSVSVFPDGVKAAELSEDVAMGQYVLALGNNLGNGIAAFDGIMSSVSRLFTLDKKVMPVYQVTAAINPGMSGGGLFSRDGKLIGINAYQTLWTCENNDRPVDNVSYCVPSSIAMRVARECALTSGGEEAALLSVRGGENSQVNFFPLYFGAKFTEQGLRINAELYGTLPVDISGGAPKVGDIVEKIGGYEVSTLENFPPLFAECLKFADGAHTDTKKLIVRLRRGDEVINISYDTIRLRNYAKN